MELINRIRKSRKGFTLVEIIVVLVILAILAAFTIPSMLGFVSDAKAKAYLAEAQAVYLAAQATSTEYYAKGDGSSVSSTSLGSTAVGASTVPADGTPAKTMLNYLNDDLTIAATKPTAKSNDSYWTVAMSTDTAKVGKVYSVTYYKGGYTTTVYGDGTDPTTAKTTFPIS